MNIFNILNNLAVAEYLYIYTEFSLFNIVPKGKEQHNNINRLADEAKGRSIFLLKCI